MLLGFGVSRAPDEWRLSRSLEVCPIARGETGAGTNGNGGGAPANTIVLIDGTIVCRVLIAGRSESEMTWLDWQRFRAAHLRDWRTFARCRTCEIIADARFASPTSVWCTSMNTRKW